MLSATIRLNEDEAKLLKRLVRLHKAGREQVTPLHDKLLEKLGNAIFVMHKTAATKKEEK